MWVVVVTKSAYGIGFGCSPAATSPAKWAMSTNSSAPDFVADFPQPREVDDARVGAAARHDHFGPYPPGLLRHGVVVDALRLLVDAVVLELEPLAPTG